MAIPLSLVDGLTLIDGTTELQLWPSQGEVAVVEFDLGHPEIRSAVVARTQANGTKDYTKNYGARTVALTLRLLPRDGRSIQAIEDDLKFWTQPDRRPVLRYTPTGAPARDFILRSSSFSGAFSMQALRTGTIVAQMQWVCPLGKALAVDDDSVDVYTNDGIGGRLYNLVFNRRYDMDIPPWGQVVGGGNTDSFPVITIYGPVQDPGIFNDTKGLGLEFTGLTLGADQTLVIDTDAKTVKLNGSSAPADNYRRFLTTRQWWAIQPGINELRYEGTVAGDSHATVEWSPAYL